MYLVLLSTLYGVLFVPQFEVNMWLNTWLVRPWRLSKTPTCGRSKKDPKKEIRKEKNSKSSFCDGSIKLITIFIFQAICDVLRRGGFYVQLSVATTTMEASPLTQQSRPDTFKPKIVQLYEDLFQVRQNPILSSQPNSFRKEKEKEKQC